MLGDPTFWVAVAFFAFFILLGALKVHKSIGSTLDAKSDAIRNQLDEAEALRSEAEKLLAEYQRKQRDAQKVAEDIVADAERAAETLKAQAEQDVKEMIARRERLAKEKLTQAEMLAVKEVQNAAVKAAVEASKAVLAEGIKSKENKALADAAIAEIDTKLH